MNGTITWNEFLKNIYEIKEFSDKINDEWQLVIDEKHNIANGYIYLKKYIKQRVNNLEDLMVRRTEDQGNEENRNYDNFISSSSSSGGNKSKQLDQKDVDCCCYNNNSTELQLDTDISTINYTNTKQLTILCYEYHLIYNISYQVPILFFNAYKSNGSLLTLNECWKIFNKINPNSQSLDMKTVLTQMEHPILFKPFFTLHPCRTANILENIPKSKNKVLSFLSAIGPTVLLNMNLLYGNL